MKIKKRRKLKRKQLKAKRKGGNLQKN